MVLGVTRHSCRGGWLTEVDEHLGQFGSVIEGAHRGGDQFGGDDERDERVHVDDPSREQVDRAAEVGARVQPGPQDRQLVGVDTVDVPLSPVAVDADHDHGAAGAGRCHGGVEPAALAARDLEPDVVACPDDERACGTARQADQYADRTGTDDQDPVACANTSAAHVADGHGQRLHEGCMLPGQSRPPPVRQATAYAEPLTRPPRAGAHRG
jgi:hypothetical protein